MKKENIFLTFKKNKTKQKIQILKNETFLKNYFKHICLLPNTLYFLP